MQFKLVVVIDLLLLGLREDAEQEIEKPDIKPTVDAIFKVISDGSRIPEGRYFVRKLLKNSVKLANFVCLWTGGSCRRGRLLQTRQWLLHDSAFLESREHINISK